MASRNGHCLCGKISFTFTGQPVRSTICHCSNCRNRTGSLFSAHIWFAADQLSMDWQDCAQYSFETPAGRMMTNYFCHACGTNLFFRTPIADPLIAVCAGTLDDANDWLSPGKELFCRNRPDFLSIDGTDPFDTQPF